MSDAKREPPGGDLRRWPRRSRRPWRGGHRLGADVSGGLETIIVTATRRAENLQDVSESITAFDTEAIEMRGLKQMDDYAKFVPGLSLGDARARRHDDRVPRRRRLRPAVRRGIVVGAVPRRAADHAERPQSRPAADRHRAPRGAARPAGHALRRELAVRHAARHHQQAGSLGVRRLGRRRRSSSIDDGGTGYDVSAMVNVPLVADRLALRLVGFTAEDAGFIDNVLSDSPLAAAPGRHVRQRDQVDEDVNSRRRAAAGPRCAGTSTDNVDVTLGACSRT